MQVAFAFVKAALAPVPLVGFGADGRVLGRAVKELDAAGGRSQTNSQNGPVPGVRHPIIGLLGSACESTGSESED